VRRTGGVDLGAELAEIRGAVEGARDLVDALVYGASPDADSARRTPRRVSAILNLLAERVRAVERACNGSVDPADVAAQFNEPLGREGACLRSWGPRRSREELTRELRRLEFESRRRRSRA
jgi:hypothetical protein